MLIRKKVNRVEYEAGGGEKIVLELGLPTREQGRPLQRHLIRFAQEMEDALHKAGGDADKITVYQQAELLDKIFEAVGEDTIKGWFSGLVMRVVSGLKIDDEPVETGAQLYEYADDAIVLFVLKELAKLSRIQPSTGKGSASLSTSSAEAGMTDGASPAPSTEREAGPTPSTVVPMRSVAS